MLSCKVDIYRLSKVRNFGCDHISWKVGQKLLATVFTFESSWVLSHFATAILRHACWIEYPVVIFYARDIAIEEEEVVLISIVFICKALTYFTNQIQITISLTFFTILSPVLVLSTVLIFLLVLRWTATVSLTFVVFQSQASYSLQWILLPTSHQVVVPLLELPATFMIHVHK